jgi:enamine deaminase RidA (YjgF/YER057c/UK114 family)
MEIKTLKLYYGGKQMPWGKACVIKNFKGLVILGGHEGIMPDTRTKDTPYEYNQPVEVAEGAEAQARLAFQKIKATLDEAGARVENIVKMWYYVVGDFPEGLAYSETWKSICKAREEFFQEYAPGLCADKNPPTFDLIGVKSLALPKMVVEIAVEAAL